MGPKTFSLDDLMHTQAKSATSTVAPTDALPYPLTDNQRLVEIIADVIDKPTVDVREALFEMQTSPVEAFQAEYSKLGIKPYVWCDKLEEFYRDTDIYLVGGVVWNRRPYKVELRKWIANYIARHRGKQQQILTVGDGVGIDSLYLAQCGHDVTYSELSEKCIRFAHQVFELANAPIKIVNELSDVKEAGYDVVMCLDVLEHVPDPHELVEQFARYLRPGGLLIVHAPFYYVSRHNPTHLSSNRKYSGSIRGLYGRHGFSLQDGRLFWDPLIFRKDAPDARKVPPKRLWKMVLRATGLLLAVGRVWCAPHNLAASHMSGKDDPRWLEGLTNDEASVEPIYDSAKL